MKDACNFSKSSGSLEVMVTSPTWQPNRDHLGITRAFEELQMAFRKLGHSFGDKDTAECFL